MYTPTNLHIAPEDTDTARTLALRLYDDDAIGALDFDDANNPYVITDEGQVISLTNAASDHGNTPDVNWVMYDTEDDFAHHKNPADQGTISHATIATTTSIDVYDLAAISLVTMTNYDRIVANAKSYTTTTAKDIADLVGLHNLDMIRDNWAYRDLYTDSVHMLNGRDTNLRLLWVGSFVGHTVTTLELAWLNNHLLNSHTNLDASRSKVIALVAVYDALRLHRAQWAHAAREHVQMNFTTIASFDLTHPDDAK